MKAGLFLLRALRHRNYRLFFIGQGVSLIGTWMQQVALSWLVYQLTSSAFFLGLVGFVGQVPAFLFSSFAGVYADRWDRRRLLIITQVLSMLQAFALGFLTLAGIVAVWHLITLAAFLGVVMALDIPVRHSFIVDMIEDKSDLGNAIALNSSMFNGARLVGPSMAGILISLTGEGVSFLLNGLSFLAIIVALRSMRLSEKRKEASRRNVMEELREGFRYAFGFPPIKYILLFLGLISLTGMPYLVLLPVFARDNLGGGPATLGFLMGSAGIGALLAALYLASRKTILGLGKRMAASACLFGSSLIVFSISHSSPLSLCMMLLSGFGMIVVMAAGNTILQTVVEEDKRGRVMSFYAMAFMGMAPFGSLIIGSLASRLGASEALIAGGSCCIIAGILFFGRLPVIREHARPIYIEKGIIEEMPSELQ
ncbi:MAG: enterobactin exporter EntS [Syntrophorhabdaceae bacterium PtaU1.Bin034]|nr:MAG: enterobactin exporter EntS [Syntrophorhabdaceae bacterium PtaU1.Bin034]